MLSVDNGCKRVSSEFSASSNAVKLGFQLLNSVEHLEDDTKPNQVKGFSESVRNTDTIDMRMDTQHSPPMYPNQSDPTSTTQQQQQQQHQPPKAQQMTDLSNCTVNSNNNPANNNNNNNTSATNNNMTNPALRIKHFAEQSDRELAELATQEISLDLQGLIEDTHFPDDNLFGDLMDTAKKNDAMYGAGTGNGMMGRGSTPGSSGQNSPGSEGQNSPPAYNHNNHYRNTLAYLPGSVHHGANYNQHQQHHHHHPQVECH